MKAFNHQAAAGGRQYELLLEHVREGDGWGHLLSVASRALATSAMHSLVNAPHLGCLAFRYKSEQLYITSLNFSMRDQRL